MPIDSSRLWLIGWGVGSGRSSDSTALLPVKALVIFDAVGVMTKVTAIAIKAITANRTKSVKYDSI